jgi:hypothetical protein
MPDRSHALQSNFFRSIEHYFGFSPIDGLEMNFEIMDFPVVDDGRFCADREAGGNRRMYDGRGRRPSRA